MVDLVLVNQCCLPGNNGLNSRSGPHGISTNVALLKGGLLRYNAIYDTGVFSAIWVPNEIDLLDVTLVWEDVFKRVVIFFLTNIHVPLNLPSEIMIIFCVHHIHNTYDDYADDVDRNDGNDDNDENDDDDEDYDDDDDGNDDDGDDDICVSITPSH